MGFVDKFLDKMKLGSNYEDEDDYDNYDEDTDEDDYVPEAKPLKKKSESTFSSVSRKNTTNDSAGQDDSTYDNTSAFRNTADKTPHRARTTTRSVSKSSQRVVSMHERTSPMEVCVMKPVTVEDGREIADTLLNGRAVILNLEGLDVELAQRIIDFTSGACFAIQGNLQRVSNYIFIVTPNSIEISGDIQELLSESISLNAGSSTIQGTTF